MIYLVRLDDVYKIGCSEHPQKRMSQFKTTHVEVELISLREGSFIEEHILHNACIEYNIKGELFKIHEDIITIFNNFQFDQIYINLRKENEDLKKEIKSLRDYIKHLEDKEINRENFTKVSEFEVIKSETKDVFFMGKTFQYTIEYSEKFIKIGSLLFYDIINKKLLNPYRKDIKQYKTKSGQTIYYIDSGLALTLEQINEIINQTF